MSEEIGELYDKMGRTPTINELNLLKKGNLVKKLWESEQKLRERVKELTCLYALSKLTTIPDISVPIVFEQILNIIPPAMQFPSRVSLRIVHENEEYKTKNFRKTKWGTVQKSKNLVIETYYDNQGEFILEERMLLKEISARLEKFIQRRQAEACLKESEEKFRSISEQTQMGIVIFQDGLVKYINEAVEQLIGCSRSEILSWSPNQLFDFIHPDDLEFAWKQTEQLFTGELEVVPSYSCRLITKEGETRWIECYSKTIRYAGNSAILTAFIDVTEKKLMERLLAKHTSDLEKEVIQKSKELIQSEKLASVGRLSAGIAHEINNPLTGIINYAQILKNEFQDRFSLCEKECAFVGCRNSCMNINIEHKPFSFVDGIVREGDRISKITSNLLAFSRKSLSGVVPTDIAVEIITPTIELLKPKLSRTNIQVRLDLDKELVPILMNPIEIRQVFLNVLQNAVDALNIKFQNNGGELVITTSTNDTHVVITVRDNGEGIHTDNIEKVFEPFFTTKPELGGAGLGMSVSYGIIKEHKGDIQIQSTLQEGTTVTILLPMVI
jgi:PAS domain S-box-containing protein